MKQFCADYTKLIYCFAVAALLAFIATGYYKSDIVCIERLYSLYQILLVYIGVKLLYTISNKWTSVIIVFLTLIICSVESYKGVSQLLGFSHSNHFLYSVSGSFENPGPYGGFMSVCISLLAAFVVYNKSNQSKGLILSISDRLITAICIVAFLALSASQSRSSILALMCSMSILLVRNRKELILRYFKKYGLWIIAMVFVLFVGLYFIKKPSADGRFFMSKICVKAICSNNLSGAGMGCFGGQYGESQAYYFKQTIEQRNNDELDWTALDSNERMAADCPTNAFNEYLFIGIEFGWVAMLLFVAMIVLSIVLSYQRGTIWCYGIITFAVFSLFSYPLHATQLRLFLPILLASCSSDRNKDSTNKTFAINRTVLDKVKYAIGGLLIIGLFFYFKKIQPDIIKYKKANSEWKQMLEWHHNDNEAYFSECCSALYPFMQDNDWFLFMYGQSLHNLGNYEKSDSILLVGTRISSDPMFWNIMGNNSLELGRYREAEERYKHAFYMVPNRLYPLHLLAKLYHAERDTSRFMDMAEKVEKFIPKVESVNTERLREEIRELKSGYCYNGKEN